MTHNQKSKHRYSTWILIGLFTLAIIGGVMGYIESEDIDEICSTNGQHLERISGKWTCSNENYGELYYHHETDALLLDLTTSNNFTQITGMTTGNCNGITCSNHTITINKQSMYNLDSTFSFTGGANGIYHCAIFVNGNEQENCEFQRTMGGGTTIGVATITCLINGTVDATIDIRCQDTNNPVADMNFYALNLNMVEI